MSLLDPLAARLRIVTLVSMAVLIAIYGAVILPNQQAIERMIFQQSSIEAQITEITELDRMYGKAFSGLSIYPEKKGERISNISLMSHLESLARKEGMGELITYMKPHEERNLGTMAQYLVEMRFDSITPSEMIAFLYTLEVKNGLFGVVQSTLEPDREGSSTFDLTLLLSRNVSF